MRNISSQCSLFLTLALLFLLSSCNLASVFSTTPTKGSELNIGDGGFLSENPCGPPCFWGITPGITTDTEALNLLELKGFNTNECDYSQRQNPDQREIGCGAVGTGYTLGITVDPFGLVTTIGFNPEISFSLMDVISKYGNPDAIYVVNQNVTAMPVDMGIRLFYDHLQAVLDLPDQEGSAVITAELEILNISYRNEQVYDESRIYTQPWHGYGNYLENP